MRTPTEYKVWFRMLDESHYWPVIEVRGEQEQVYKFIELHWDKDVADATVYNTGPFA
jgi:hypothetical protein